MRGWGWLLLLARRPAGGCDRRRDDDGAGDADDDADGRQELQGVPVGDPGDVAAAACGRAVRPAPWRAVAPALAGALAGLVSAGLAATLYASHCTDDSPLFVATWYTLATALVTAIGALLGAKVLRY